jgi:diadenosine tetraphosphatase ApaH/serine/threonine PP2A family protein phosphatase
MRLALIADVHSNLEALTSVLARIRQEGVEQLINLGDLVGYNASPNECLELLKDETVWSLAGNHDLALLEPRRARHFNQVAFQALNWSREQLWPIYQEFLRGLPLTLEVAGLILACHGSPSSPDVYLDHLFQARRAFSELSDLPQLRACFFAHTHQRALWHQDREGRISLLDIFPAKMPLEPDGRYLLNPGSVGQPRDGNPEAAYAIFDTEEFSVHFHSVPYDVLSAQRRIFAAGLPPFLAERLALGI